MVQKLQNLKKKKGFTLVELIIVVVIIGILIGLGAMLYSSATEGAEEGVVKGNLKTIESAVILYQTKNNGSFPAADLTFAKPAAGTTLTDADLRNYLTEDTYTQPKGWTYKWIAADKKITATPPTGSTVAAQEITIK